MELIHNQTFRLLPQRIDTRYPAGIYRVILDEPLIDKTVVVYLAATGPKRKPYRSSARKSTKAGPLKKPPPPLVGQLIWIDRDLLLRMEANHLLVSSPVEREPIYFQPIKSLRDRKIFDLRVKAMRSFLNYEELQESILVHSGLGGLVTKALTKVPVSRNFIYKQWSTLCRLGIDETSLLPRLDRCGAPGEQRPCDPKGRKKPGPKTIKQRIGLLRGDANVSTQPAMSTEWRAKITAADKAIKTPIKPRMSKRYNDILDAAFVKGYKLVGGEYLPVPLVEREYPTKEQVRRVLTEDISRLQRLRESTTSGHFSRAMRGLSGRNWKGVSGPGHTWAIDSTIADIYLRSSINRAWIVGRPVVYIIVDVWSTAIVGFYVCLTGPSWNTAKISLFNACAGPELMDAFWGCPTLMGLNPLPTMCFALMCDRGEYLSKGASYTSLKLIPCLSYAPPYRPDLKGLVEVLHRIQKDAQYLFVPGAMDARRAELELRKSRPAESAMTLREYVQYLYYLFDEYNLTANRLHRIDAHMGAAGVFPSPAGLWRWGHMVGIGFRRATTRDDLISALLPSATARVGASSVRYAGNDYMSDVLRAEEWTTHSRNFGGWDIPINTYPGSVSRIWTPNTNGTGLLDLQISDEANASPELTYEELADSIAYQKLQKEDVIHAKTIQSLNSQARIKALLKSATLKTKEALDNDQGVRPTVREARHIEVKGTQEERFAKPKSRAEERDEAMENQEAMMRSILAQLD